MVIASLLMLVWGGERSAIIVFLQKKSPARIQLFSLSAVGRLASNTTVPVFLRVLATDAKQNDPSRMKTSFFKLIVTLQIRPPL